MKNLDNIIRNNKDRFNEMEPPEGHMERFQQRLEKYNKKSPTLHVSFSAGIILKAAVVSILVVLSSLWVYEHINEPDQPQQIVLKEASPEFREAQIYYSSMVQKKYSQIKDFNFKNSEQKEMLLQELNTMDSIYVNIKKDIKEHPNDPRVLNALIRHYQMKLDVMNRILEQLNQIQAIQRQNNSNHKNQESHETTQI